MTNPTGDALTADALTVGRVYVGAFQANPVPMIDTIRERDVRIQALETELAYRNDVIADLRNQIDLLRNSRNPHGRQA
jgi:hypothetical protein